MSFEDLHEEVSVGRIKAGDTVLIDGTLRTVCQKDLGRGDLLGPTLWGDSYRSGLDKVTRVTFGAELERRESARIRALEEVSPEVPSEEDTCPEM